MNVNRKLASFVIVVLTFAVTIARAIRLPNDFSEAHWLLDYRFGFMKRGLIGSLCSVATGMAGFRMTPCIIVGLSALTFCCLCAALLFLLFRSLRRHEAASGSHLTALVFASSPFLVMSAHLFGYFDALIYTFAIAAIALTLSDRPFVGALVSAVAMLSHESYLLIGFPMVCFASFMLCRSEDGRCRRARHAAAQSIPLLVFLAIVAIQLFVGDQQVLREQLTAYLGSFDDISTRSRDVALWQTTGFFELFQLQGEPLVERLLRREVLASVGPTLLILLCFNHAAFRVRLFGFTSLALLGAVAAPLAMHTVAWDTARISTYTIGGAFIGLWILAEIRKPEVTGNLFALVAIPTLLLNVFSHMPLMDGEVENFTVMTRLLAYSPALALALIVIIRNNTDRR